jgi:hypothetical protein
LWSGDGSNSPFGPVATRSVVVAERAGGTSLWGIPAPLKSAHRAPQRSGPRGGAAHAQAPRPGGAGVSAPGDVGPSYGMCSVSASDWKR